VPRIIWGIDHKLLHEVKFKDSYLNVLMWGLSNPAPGRPTFLLTLYKHTWTS